MAASTTAIRMLKRIRVVTLALCFLGFGLCSYSVYVSYRKEANNEYKAFCDISDSVSCSKVFTSKYGKGFGLLASYLGKDSRAIVSNGIYGIVFYSIVAMLGELTSVFAAHTQRLIVLLSNAMSLYLAYVLAFVLRDACLVCITSYVVNILLAVCCFMRVNYLSSLRSKKKPSNKGSDKTAAKSQNAKNQSNKGNQTPKKEKVAQKSTSNKENQGKTQNAKNIQNNAKNIQNTNKNNQNATKKQNPNKNAQIANKNNQNSNKSANSIKSSNKNSKKKN